MAHQLVTCSMCGNGRSILSALCPYCGEKDYLSNNFNVNTSYKINLELGLPKVDEALHRFENHLDKLRGKNFRMLQVIHGQGSKGTTGKIKAAFREALDYGKWSDSISEVYYGEALRLGHSGLEDFRKSHPSLISNLSKEMLGNAGITILIMNKQY